MRVEPGARPGHIVDVFDPEEGVAYEAKVGFKTLTPLIRDQIDADVALLEDLASGVLRVEWHFYPSAVTKDWGPSISLMDYLEKSWAASERNAISPSAPANVP